MSPANIQNRPLLPSQREAIEDCMLLGRNASSAALL
jgi:hypothetical protein